MYAKEARISALKDNEDYPTQFIVNGQTVWDTTMQVGEHVDVVLPPEAKLYCNSVKIADKSMKLRLAQGAEYTEENGIDVEIGYAKWQECHLF